MHAIAFSSRKFAGFLLLILSGKIKSPDIRPGIDLAISELDELGTVGDFLINGFFRIERAVLIDVSQLDGLADGDRSLIRCFLAGDHLEQRRFTGTVRPDDPHDSSWRKTECEVVVK